MPDLAFFDDRIVPIEEARISVKTHALHYGTSAFEGIRVNWRDDEKKFYIFRALEHYQRLLNSCKILKMDLSYSIDQLCKISVELVEKTDHREDIYIRPIAYKSTEVVGVKLHGLDCALAMFIIPFGPYIDVNNGIRCGTSSWRKINGDQMPNQAKIAGPYINHAMAKTEAIENGFDEAILLTLKVDGANHLPTGIMDIEVTRNAFGRQVDSFEIDLDIPVIGDKPYHAIFIRAPKIESTGSNVDILAKLSDDTIVAAQQGNMIALAFHPELTDDKRLHQYFLDIVNE